MKLDNAQITTKAVEIGKCLVGTIPGMFTHDLGVTRTIGDAARLAITVRQRGGEISQEQLAAVSTALKIDSRLTETDLVPLFDELGWWDVKRKGRRVTGVVERIPPVEDVLGTLGEEWRNRAPTSIDEASLKALTLLSNRPYEKQALISELEVATDVLDGILDYGEQAQYLGELTSDSTSEKIVYTPHYWARNAEKVSRFLEKQNEPGFSSIAKMTADFSQYPGLPLDRIDLTKYPLLMTGLANGFYPTGGVKDRSDKEFNYVFPPSPVFGIDPKDDMFEKARMIVSCIRHGQYHAEVSTIKYPQSILRAMRTNSMKPHPYAKIQYAILGLNQILLFEEASTRYGPAWRTIFNDTPENQVAADIADQMLRGQTPVPMANEEADAIKVLAQGSYNYSAEQRKIKTGQKIQAKNEYNRLMELVGVTGR